MNELEIALDYAAKEKNTTPSEFYNKIIGPIAFHESDRTMNPKLKQTGGGLGKGIMQYDTGTDRLTVSRQRAINFFNSKNIKVPDWVLSIDQSKMDATSLTGEQQQALATYDILMGRGNASDVLKGNIRLEKFWLDNWNQPNKTEKDYAQTKQNRILAFQSNLKKYEDVKFPVFDVKETEISEKQATLAGLNLKITDKGTVTIDLEQPFRNTNPGQLAQQGVTQ